MMYQKLKKQKKLIMKRGKTQCFTLVLKWPHNLANSVSETEAAEVGQAWLLHCKWACCGKHLKTIFTWQDKKVTWAKPGPLTFNLTQDLKLKLYLEGKRTEKHDMEWSIGMHYTPHVHQLQHKRLSRHIFIFNMLIQWETAKTWFTYWHFRESKDYIWQNTSILAL